MNDCMLIDVMSEGKFLEEHEPSNLTQEEILHGFHPKTAKQKEKKRKEKEKMKKEEEEEEGT